MGCDEVLEVRRADLFLTLDEHLDADRGEAPKSWATAAWVTIPHLSSDAPRP